MNWLEGMQETDGPSRPMAMRVFAGQKLVVVGGSSGMGRQTAADVVAAGGSVVIIGHSNTVPELIHELGDIDVPPIGDDEYDTLYVLSIPSFGHASLLRMAY